MTMMFVLTGTLSTQLFSYAWYRDDAKKPETPNAWGHRCAHVWLGHHLQVTYYQLLKESWRVFRNTANSPPAGGTETHHDRLFCMAADLCMLKVFEAFLESVPQLLLQVCIIQSQNETSFIQGLSVAFSLINVAHSLMDYSSYLRSCILSYSLLITVSVYSTAALTVLWLLLTVWVHFLNTNFCTSKALEFFYRTIVGAILVFTFFNVKGKDTKLVMTVYYISHAILNIAAPILFVLLVPGPQTCKFLWTAGLIGGTTILGYMCLILYYSFLHPKGMEQEPDEVDGLETEATATRRMRSFLQP
ncbi:XK-related protein 9 [Oryzias melastigma]|uniref:XK-related protein n=1 Tax=Oryzias melastigma TaxID=30732 RepID=A0A834FDP9_ORYME|nr:XK-related protein 9 [Oryzias melastigma]